MRNRLESYINIDGYLSASIYQNSTAKARNICKWHPRVIALNSLLIYVSYACSNIEEVLLCISMLLIHKICWFSFPGKTTGVNPHLVYFTWSSVNLLGLTLYTGAHVVFTVSRLFTGSINCKLIYPQFPKWQKWRLRRGFNNGTFPCVELMFQLCWLIIKPLQIL